MLGLIEKARALLVGLAPFFVFHAGLEIAGLALAIERLGARPQPRLDFEAVLVGFPNALAALHIAVILAVAVASHVAIGVLAAVLADHAFPAPQAVVLRAAYRLCANCPLTYTRRAAAIALPPVFRRGVVFSQDTFP